ncbi:MAG: redoxin domain-containing protein [Armatimonadetes bacterium]|nr:redoxin domain-containing protein [Armatimonadota bacterium]
MKYILPLLLVLVLLWAQPAGAALKVGQQPANFTLPTLTGSTVSLSQFHGRNCVLLVFWATWCPACREELPKISQIEREYRSRGVAVVSINVDKSRRAVDSLAKALGLSFPVLLDPRNTVVKEYGVKGIPYVLILDKESIVRYQAFGYPADFRTVMAPLLGEKPRSTSQNHTSQSGSKVRELDSRTLKALLSGKTPPVLLDVRTESEYKFGHLSGTLWIPVDQLEQKVRGGELRVPKDRPIVVYCAGGGRSPRGAEILKAQGFKQVYNLTKGISEWLNAGYPVEK